MRKQILTCTRLYRYIPSSSDDEIRVFVINNRNFTGLTKAYAVTSTLTGKGTVVITMKSSIGKWADIVHEIGHCLGLDRKSVV